MPRKRSIIPAAPMSDILRNAGAERVSDSAARELAEVLMERAMQISKKAVEFSAHAGRKTIKKEDIVLAKKSI